MRAAPRDHGREDGFALAEVLVAFAILALVTLAMMRAFAGSTASVTAVARSDARLDLAERILERARAAPWLPPARRQGVEDGLAWWSLVEPVEGAGLPPPDGAKRLVRVTVGVGPKRAPATAPLLGTLVLTGAPR